MTMSENKKAYQPKRITASLMGKMVKVVPTRNSIDIYIQPTWLMIVAVWVFGGAFFALSLVWFHVISSCILTVIGGVLGFYLTSKFAIGKLHKSFNYHEIVCIVANVPELTIVHGDQKMFELRMLTRPQKKLVLAIVDAIKEGPYSLVKKHGRYYVALKDGCTSTSKIETI